MKLLKSNTFLISAALLVAQPVFATAELKTYLDPCNNCSPYTAGGGPLYYGGDGTAPGGDILGQTTANDPYEQQFDILSLTAEQSGSVLKVDITTRFVEATPLVSNVIYGDLLIATGGWSPNPPPAPYANDTATSSFTVWDYLIDTHMGKSFPNDGNIIPGFTISYAADVYNNAALEKSDTAPHDTAFFRADQYVRRLPGGVGPTGDDTATVTISGILLPNTVDGSVDAPGTLLQYIIPLSDLGLTAVDPYSIGLRWTMTCANDIIEAAYTNVPESSSLSLMVGGLMGLLLMRRRTQTALFGKPA